MITRPNQFHLQNKAKCEIKNYRPIDITNIICKIWETIITIRLKPYLNFQTSELQNAYKGGRSNISILDLINKQIKRE